MNPPAPEHGGNAAWRTAVRDLLNGAFLAACVTALYARILGLWWTYDDAFLLHYVIRNRPGGYLFSPRIWQEIPQQLFTPVLTLAYDTDVVLFGVEARWYYAHHLLELIAMIALVYAVARLWHDRIVSVTCALLVALGAPFCAWATQLMLRHYVEAAIAALTATWLFVTGERRGRHSYAWLAAAAYFVAICAKEIAVPLPLILLLTSTAPFRERVRALAPQAVALLAYTAWRYYMLGALFGGYGWAVTRDELAPLLLMLVPKITGTWLPAGSWAAIALVACGVAVAALAVRSGRAALLVLAAVACAVLPIAPVSKEMQLRFAVVPWVAFSFAIAAGLSALRARPRAQRLAPIVAAVLVLLAAAANRAEWRRTFGQASRMSAEARAFIDLGPGEMLRNPMVPPAAMGELQWLKTNVYGKVGGASWSFDDIYYCVNALPKRVIEYDKGRIRDVTTMAPRHVQRYCSSRSRNALHADFAHRDATLFWKLGPHTDGQYRFILGDGIQAFDVPREDGFKLGPLPGIALRIRHLSSGGAVTYSPTIAIDFASQPTLQWRGTGDVH